MKIPLRTGPVRPLVVVLAEMGEGPRTHLVMIEIGQGLDIIAVFLHPFRADPVVSPGQLFGLLKGAAGKRLLQ